MKWSGSDRFVCRGSHRDFWSRLSRVSPGSKELIRIMPEGTKDPDDALAVLLQGKERAGNSGWDNTLLMWVVSWHLVSEDPEEVSGLDLWVWKNSHLEECLR